MKPIASRPHMPGYGLLGSEEGSGLLPWGWATERLESSHDYWLATRWPDGRPHVMPVWGVWLEDMVWFSSSGSSRKTKNLAHNPTAVITTDNPLQPVVLEGDVDRIAAPPLLESFVDTVNRKYETDYSVSFFERSACFRLSPRWAFGLSEGDFTGSPTRWTFAPEGDPR